MSSDKKNDESTIDGLAVAGRAVGRAMGYFRRLTQRDSDKDEEGDERKERRKKARKRTSRASKTATTTSKRASRGSAGREQLAEQITRIEREIDRVYGAIVSGASSEHGQAGSASKLSDLIQRSRELKRELGEKRADLARLERDAERERVLKRRAAHERNASDALETGPPAKEKARPKKAKRGRRAAKAKALPRGPSQLQQELGRITFEDDSVRFVFERVAQNLSDPDPDVRKSAAVKLGELDMPAASRVLAHVVEDPAEKVSIAALNALVRLGSSDSVGVFKRHLGSDNQHIRLAALRGLAKAGDGDGSVNPRLIDALEDEQPAIRKTAATLLGWREATDAVTPLLSALRDEEESVRVAAATALGALRLDKAVLSLIRTLLDPALEVRKAAHQSLKAILGQEVEVEIEDDASLIDSSMSNNKRERQVEALKEWWRTARVDKQLEREAGPPLPEDVMGLKPPAEPLGPPPEVKEEEFEALLPEVEEEEKKEEVEEEEKKEEVEEEEFESLLDASFGGEAGEGEGEGEGEYESLLDGDLAGGEEEPAKESKKKKKKD